MILLSNRNPLGFECSRIDNSSACLKTAERNCQCKPRGCQGPAPVTITLVGLANSELINH